MGALGTWDLADELQVRPDSRRTTTIATVSRVDDDGSVWVRLPGADADTPVNGQTYVDAEPGQTVQATIEGGRCSITGNATAPAVGGTYVARVVEPVDLKATNALEEAQRAHDAADVAEKDADRARVAAESAEGSAADAANAATAAQGSASTAAGAATQAQSSASQASSAASQAQADASTAATAAGNAATSAANAASSASQAASDAASANRSANSALTQLSVVQDVAGTLSWIAEHGTYRATTDTSVVDGRVYFELDDGEYVPVVEPSGNPSASGWYVLDISDSQTDYIMAHLAVTSAGLWVLPSGMGQAQTPQSAPGYKLLLASDGSYMYDDSGHLVRSDTAQGTVFDSSRPQYIGGENAFIVYYDSDNDGVPDSIRIGGSRVSMGGKSLSAVLADIEQAKTDAETAVQTAEDVPIVTLSSTNGTVFKRNLGVSTTLIATIFTPGGRIDNATELHRRFGAGAYLQWGWRDVVTDADHILLVTDPRITQGGFALTVNPEDIDTQAVITCSLIV